MNYNNQIETNNSIDNNSAIIIQDHTVKTIKLKS